eukprot:TRINITY_DN15548_c0_g1_i1.p1 TRINITY_DN15548_c0_g1~~TRINITY_DN15548_c0_g1_i1.p1  ORF type:complete len:116 (-),score=11.17 TRINITY_DN15548_c0_g1_i1:269-616(-)
MSHAISMEDNHHHTRRRTNRHRHHMPIDRSTQWDGNLCAYLGLPPKDEVSEDTEANDETEQHQHVVDDEFEDRITLIDDLRPVNLGCTAICPSLLRSTAGHFERLTLKLIADHRL